MLNEYAKQRTISLEENMRYLPILFCMKKWSDSLKECDRGSVQFIMKNIGYELFQKTADRVVCADIHERGIAVLLCGTWSEEEVQKSCRQYLDTFRESFHCDISGYCGESVKLEELAEEISDLRREERNNVSVEGQIWKKACKVKKRENMIRSTTMK